MENPFKKSVSGPEITPFPTQAEHTFETTFGIAEQELETLEGYATLSEGQRALVLHNFNELALEHITTSAAEKRRGETERGRLGRELLKRYYIAKSEKETAAEFREGGLQKHGALLQELVRQTREIELDAEVNKDGTLSLLFAGRFENMSAKGQSAVARFNAAARALSQTPIEWKYEKAKQKQFAKTQTLYDEARASLFRVVRKQHPDWSEENVLQHVAQIDKRVSWAQFLNSSPETEKMLQRINSKWVWARALRNMAFERGGYMAMGGIARTATVSLLGALAAPLAAAGIGGLIARRRAIEKLEEEAALARAGTAQKKEKITKGELNVVTAEALAKKLERLAAECEESSAVEKETALKTRLYYTQQKLREGLVDFGDEKESLAKKYALISIISRANAIDALLASKEKSVAVRLDQYLSYKDKNIRTKVRWDAFRGALISAGFAGIGYGARYLLDLLGMHPAQFIGKKISEILPEARKEGLPSSLAEGARQGTATADSSLNRLGERAMPPDTAWEDLPPAAQEAMRPEQYATVIHKGGNAWNAARELVKQGKITESEFKTVWENSTIELADGREIPIAKLDLVHEGDEVRYIPGKNNAPGAFEIINASDKPMGDTADLYRAAVRENSGAPAWLEREIRGIDEHTPLNPAPMVPMSYTGGTQTFNVELPSLAKEWSAALAFHEDLPKVWADLTVQEESFKKLSLLSQERVIRGYATLGERFRTYEKFANAFNNMSAKAKQEQFFYREARSAWEHLQKAHQNLETKFWKTLGKSITRDEYRTAIVEKGITVKQLIGMWREEQQKPGAVFAPKWAQFAKWAIGMKPEEADLRASVDTFVRSRFTEGSTAGGGASAARGISFYL